MSDVYFKATKATKATKQKLKKLKEKQSKAHKKTRIPKPVDPIQIQTIENLKTLAKLPESQTSGGKLKKTKGGAIMSSDPKLQKLAQKYSKLLESRSVGHVVDPVEAQRIQALRSVAEIPMKGDYPSGLSYQFFLEEEKKKKAEEAEKKKEEEDVKKYERMLESQKNPLIVLDKLFNSLYENKQLGFTSGIETNDGVEIPAKSLNSVFTLTPGLEPDATSWNKKLNMLDLNNNVALKNDFLTWEQDNYDPDESIATNPNVDSTRKGVDETDAQFKQRAKLTLEHFKQYLEDKGVDLGQARTLDLERINQNEELKDLLKEIRDRLPQPQPQPQPQPTGSGFNFDDMHPSLQGGLLAHDIIHNNPLYTGLRPHANKMLLNLANIYGKPIYKDLVSKLVNHGKTISNFHPAVSEGFKNVLSKVQGGSFFDDIKNKFGNFILKYNPLTLMLKHSIDQGMEARRQKQKQRY
jgi:hypothetical protein